MQYIKFQISLMMQNLYVMCQLICMLDQIYTMFNNIHCDYK